MEINFHNIRAHNGSKNSGFEELVCQLAHLQKPDRGKRFVRKEGAGGDAGVECYWVLDDDSEMGWQVKYFPDKLNSSHWQQIDKSFSVAIKKHPKLNHYIVCLPLDKTDSRKKGKRGEQVISAEDKWSRHVQKWEKQAKTIGRKIKFSYWGKHEITTFLTIDNPLYSGKALYWFNEPLLCLEKFSNIVERAQDILGDRYSPEFHVDLPIARNFDGLCLNPSWWDLLKKKKLELKDSGSEVISFLKQNKIKDTLFDNEKLNKLDELLNNTINEFSKGITSRDFHKRRSVINCLLDELIKLYLEVYNDVYDKIDGSNNTGNSRSILDNLFSVIEDLLYFIKQKKSVLSQTKSVLLYGDAGIGKSHLLCDLSLHRIKANLPTLFLLGTQYCGGNPINFVKESLDLQSYRNCQVLGVIDAAGEASGVRVLIIIDAINEGSHREDWRNQIKGFLFDLSKFQYIAVLFSCRTTYINYILPDNIDKNCLPRIKHYGFSGHENRATEKYLSKQGISKPSVPILSPEFTNPLFLQICCRTLKQNKQHSFPKGLNSIATLFDFYIESIEKTIAKKKKYNPKEEIIKSILIKIASKLLPDCLEGIPVQDARCLVNSNDPNPNINDSLFNILLDENILSEDVSYKEFPSTPVIRFTYERFSDYFIAQELLCKVDKLEDIKKIFFDKGTINRLLKEKGYNSIAGIFEALSIIIAEKFNSELEDLLPDNIGISERRLAETFKNTVLWRSPNSFSERTLELLNNLDNSSDNYSSLEILLKLSTEPNHKWNAELLHKKLIDKKIADRDYCWSIYIASSDSSEEDDEYESIIRTIIEWSHSGEIESVEEERIRLCAITLLWCLTTSNRKTRDQSTKSLVRVLSSYPNLVKDLLIEFSKINDIYLVERLFAVAYGVVCNIDNNDIIQEIANVTYTLIFKQNEPIPHILLRDYARGILEYALHLGLLSPEISPEQFRPPYKSKSELKNPSRKEIEKITGDTFSARIENSLMGFPCDFGNYTMSCVRNWSSTPISLLNVENAPEIKERFDEQQGPLGINNDKLASFSMEWAQRWVCKRSYEFGGSDELFDDFESRFLHGRDDGIRGEKIERVGKKYQWMAFHEFLARLSDNYYWINRGYADLPDDDVYEGPWQIFKRDIDPTIWARQCDEYKTYYNKKCTWWQPYSFPFPNKNDLSIKTSFLWDENIVPDFSDLLQRKMPVDNSNWLVLHGLCHQNIKYFDDNSKSPHLDAWFRITSIFIRKGDYALLAEEVKEKSLCDPNIVDMPLIDYGFLGEYPWHTIYRHTSGWQNPEEGLKNLISVKHFIPFTQYEWEDRGADYSLNSTLYFNMPAKELIQDMGLYRPLGQWGSWEQEGKLVFCDPSIEEYGPSYALIRNDKILHKWLEKNDMEIVWLIGGEKQMVSFETGQVFGRLVYSGLFKYKDDRPEGNIWFIKEKPPR